MAPGAGPLDEVQRAPADAASAPAARPAPSLPLRPAQPPEMGEFERLATEANAGRPVQRFGSSLRRADGFGPGLAAHLPPETPARVPPGYIVQVGDEVTVSLWGGVEAEWRLRVDRGGRLSLPRVGPLAVAGVEAGGLEPMLRSRLERIFKGFELAAAVTEISPLRIQITGFVERPGAYVVPGLSTISAALAQAQGPAAGGSYRRIRLLRNGQTVVLFDLYAVLADAQRSADRLLQPGDVLHVEAVGPQVAMLGSVNRPAVFEVLPGETVADALRLAGGYSSVADGTRLSLERLRDRRGVGAVELRWPGDAAAPLNDGDLLRALSQVDAALPTQGRNKRVRIEGEVLNPGDYLLPPTATLADALVAAGGPTAAAFLFGTELRRERVRLAQQANYDRALQELEAEISRAAAARNPRDDSPQPSDAGARQLLSTLRARRPEGRLVLDVSPDSAALPALPLEDGDQLRLPPRTQAVGVFGSVFNAGSFVHRDGQDLGDYLRRAGGATGGADYASAFVIRANGSVASARQGGWWNGVSLFEQQPALPGDTVYVPEKLDRTTFVQGAKDWTQILYQLGVGVAALLTIK
jgi:protein involved in polysaccharide export with SLBB domain